MLLRMKPLSKCPCPALRHTALTSPDLRVGSTTSYPSASTVEFRSHVNTPNISTQLTHTNTHAHTHSAANARDAGTLRSERAAPPHTHLQAQWRPEITCGVHSHLFAAASHPAAGRAYQPLGYAGECGLSFVCVSTSCIICICICMCSPSTRYMTL